MTVSPILTGNKNVPSREQIIELAFKSPTVYAAMSLYIDDVITYEQMLITCVVNMAGVIDDLIATLSGA